MSQTSHQARHHRTFYIISPKKHHLLISNLLMGFSILLHSLFYLQTGVKMRYGMPRILLSYTCPAICCAVWLYQVNVFGKHYLELTIPTLSLHAALFIADLWIVQPPVYAAIATALTLSATVLYGLAVRAKLHKDGALISLALLIAAHLGNWIRVLLEVSAWNADALWSQASYVAALLTLIAYFLAGHCMEPVRRIKERRE